MAARVAVPVSRGSEHYAGALGEAEPTLGRIMLKPAEREIANLPGGPGGAEYAWQKLKLAKRKKAGLYKED